MGQPIERIEYISFAKGFALTVILYHFLQPFDFGNLFQQAIAFGGTGIHLFFLLSGYGLGLKPPGNIFGFYKKRFRKILVPYYIFVTIAFVVGTLTTVYSEFDYRHYLSHIFLYKMFFKEYIGSYGYQLWFISSIIQFYILFPLLYQARIKFGNTLFLIIIISISFSYSIYLGQNNLGAIRTYSSFFPQYLWEFGLGIVFANLKNNKSWFSLNIWVYLVTFAIGLFLMALLSLKFGQTGKILNDFPAFCAYFSFSVIVYRISQLEQLSYIKRILLRVGEYSYELYLVHIIVLLSLIEIVKPFGYSYNLFWLAIALVLTFGVAILFQQFLKMIREKPGF